MAATVLRDRSIMTEPSHPVNRRFCGLTVHETLSLISSLLLPLMLGVFTVVITFHQQNVAVQQRLEDRQLAREQREQDLNVSREQRQQDLLMFALQREQDLNISHDQRQHDKEIAENKRMQDYELAEKQRNLSDVQRAHELKITKQQTQDALLVAYMNDIAALLKENHGNLTDNPTVGIIARAKTIAAIRQLDISRKTQIIQFLYEAKQLISGANPLDLSDAELNGIDFTTNKSFRQHLHGLSLAGALLRESLFYRLDLTNANFSGADLTRAKFNDSSLDNADLSGTIIVRTDFTDALLKGTRFDNTHSRSTSFRNAYAPYATFIKGNFESAMFSGCECRDVNFEYATVDKSNFSRAHLDRSRFSEATITGTTFTHAYLTSSNLQGVRLRRSDLSNTQCKNVTFTKAELIDVLFVQATFGDVNFTNLTLRGVDFSHTDLTLATFSHAKLDDAKFNRTIVIMADFSFASLKKAYISDEQLFSALSIQRAVLPNGTVFARDFNLLNNGYANCNNTLLNTYWQISPPGAIVVSPKLDLIGDCLFASQMINFSSMSQRVNLTKYLPLTSRNRALYVLMARGGGNISSVRIDDHGDRFIAAGNFTRGSDLLTLRARSKTYQPKVTVQFFGNGWCDDIELTIEMTPRIP